MAHHSLARRLCRSTLAVAVLALGIGCSKEEVKPEAAPKLGVLELPIAHRTGDPLPAGAARLEVTPSEIALDGETVLKLDKGKLLPGDRAGYDLPTLKTKLSGKPAVAIGVYAAVPYATLARVMHTALAAGITGLSFKVRKPNAKTETGYLTVPRNHFVESAEEDGFDREALASWDTFANAWEEALTACQVSARADCGYRPEVKAQGGKLELMLRVRGAGLALRFRQAGAAASEVDAGPAVDKSRGKMRKRAELIDGVPEGTTEARLASNEPATEHTFTLRSDQATIEPSPITGIVRPVCGDVSCAVVVDAEGITMSGQVLGLLGAAFADGMPAPTVAWVLPPKDG